MQYHLMAFTLLCGAVGVWPAAGQDVVHRESPVLWRRTPVTNSILDDRIRQAALEYRSYAPIPRVAFYDIAYPKDSLEFEALAGYAVMVLTAVSHVRAGVLRCLKCI